MVEELEFDVEINNLLLGDFDLSQQKVNTSFSRRSSSDPVLIFWCTISTLTDSFAMTAAVSRAVCSQWNCSLLGLP